MLCPAVMSFFMRGWHFPYTLVQSANWPAAFWQLTDILCRRTSANAADSPHLPRYFPLYIYSTGILQFSNSA